MSTNYSKISVKFGSIEITIEGIDKFVAEQYREIFNLQNDQIITTDREDQFAQAQDTEQLDSPKSDSPSFKEIKGQTQKHPKTPKTEETQKTRKTQKTQKKIKSSKKSTKSTQSPKPKQVNTILNTLGSSFGEWLANLPNKTETRDKILAAAYFNQKTHSENKFYMRGIKSTLTEHGFSVSNIPSFLDTFEIQKIITKVSDSSRKGYRFTQEGEKYMMDLMN